MKKISLLAIIPMLAAVGCSSPIAMQSTEYDDMYYSSSDETTYIEPEEQTYATTEEYMDSQTLADAGAEGSEYVGEDEYYDGREYTPREYNPYGYNYSFVDPYWGSAYTPGFGNPYYGSAAFYDPFYSPYYGSAFSSPFYDPFMRSPWMRSGLSLSLSFGNMWGSPFYGGYGYSPFYSRWASPYYNGFYNGLYYDRPFMLSDVRKVQYAPRQSRSVVRTDNVEGAGRPVRGAGSINAGNAVMSRPVRAAGSTAGTVGTDNNNATTTRSSRTQYYDPSRGTRSTRQSGRVVQSQEQRAVSPARESRSRQTYTPRREYRQQYQSRPIEARPSYEQRSSFPSSSPMPSRGSSTGSSSGGGRPPRGGNR